MEPVFSLCVLIVRLLIVPVLAISSGLSTSFLVSELFSHLRIFSMTSAVAPQWNYSRSIHSLEDGIVNFCWLRNCEFSRRLNLTKLLCGLVFACSFILFTSRLLPILLLASKWFFDLRSCATLLFGACCDLFVKFLPYFKFNTTCSWEYLSHFVHHTCFQLWRLLPYSGWGNMRCSNCFQLYAVLKYRSALAGLTIWLFKRCIVCCHYTAQASCFAVFVESGTRKLRKVVESRTKFLFDVPRQNCCYNDTLAAALWLVRWFWGIILNYF